MLRRRVDQLGVSEPSLQRSGDRRIIVELPGLADPEEAVAVIGKTAELTFHPVVAPGGAERTLPDETGVGVGLGPAAVTGNDVGTASATIGGSFSVAWQVQVEFRNDRAWTELTGAAACAAPGDPARRIAIVLDEKVISSPQVAPEIRCGQGITGGTTSITGNFGEDEAKDLALLIRAGALPVPVEVVEQRTIGPTLGDAAVRASIQAAAIGALLTTLYMIAYYRLLGVLAVLALAAYGGLSFAVLLLLGATLTLPGIAGFVLAIGMAVDANVLVYERIKEEAAGGASTRRAVQRGFERAWTAIADSNATTLLAAVLLFFFASGAVRGFGITLTIGVLVSVFTALVVTRLLLDLVLRTRLRDNPRLLGLEVGGRFRAWIARRRPNLLRHSRRWLAGSAVALALAVTGIATQGLQYGLEFSGGRLLEYDTARPADLDAVRRALADAGFPQAVVQESGDGNVAIRTTQLSADEERRVQAAVEATAGETVVLRDEFVGPTIGQELRRKALIALGLALAAQLAYLTVRFRWTYAAGAVAAMAHDVLLLLGVFAWLSKTLDGVFLAALLTVIGYSINDSVVVFDRIRELRRSRTKEPLVTVANDACLQTVPRTINTGLGALFILVALYLLGGETLTDFALALLVGIVVGTYSSVFTATPLAVWFEGWRERNQGEPAPRPLKPVGTPPPVATAPVDVLAVQKAAHPASGSSPRPAPRPRKQRRKPARRP
ncbi:MAG: Protein translocase subunit SecD / Protein translocase subunit SecF [uncultured Acidimicrobiales bacterium]|uniref:Multifunctional fusion protein n=1 Tax=uncultured Acidimicrobiales bacterium TaxID=310071 RepID=A0A6J4J766_9ACTN|nr:MAG: Protein translocase subunit SecD / Protein translocase subunit SecF [uncultured Acidimicrobiales bacterium]